MFVYSGSCLDTSVSQVHSYDIVHGDLTGANILIDDQRKACLCDFGLSNIIDFEASNVYSSVSGAIRWADASLYRMQIEDHVPKPTKRSDIYSFGSVTLEVSSMHSTNMTQFLVLRLHSRSYPAEYHTTTCATTSKSSWSYTGETNHEDRPLYS